MSTLANILSFINEHKSSKVFGKWDSSYAEHRASIIDALCNKMAFYSTDNRGRVDGIAMVSSTDYKHFHVSQLIAKGRAARQSIVRQFLVKWPGAIITSFDRRGRTKSWKNHEQLIRHFTNI